MFLNLITAVNANVVVKRWILSGWSLAGMVMVVPATSHYLRFGCSSVSWSRYLLPVLWSSLSIRKLVLPSLFKVLIALNLLNIVEKNVSHFIRISGFLAFRSARTTSVLNAATWGVWPKTEWTKDRVTIIWKSQSYLLSSPYILKTIV